MICLRFFGEEKAGKEGLKGDQVFLGEGSFQKGKDVDRGCYREMRRKAFQEQLEICLVTKMRRRRDLKSYQKGYMNVYYIEKEGREEKVFKVIFLGFKKNIIMECLREWYVQYIYNRNACVYINMYMELCIRVFIVIYGIFYYMCSNSV